MGKALPKQMGYNTRLLNFQLLHYSLAVQQFIYQERIMGGCFKISK